MWEYDIKRYNSAFSDTFLYEYSVNCLHCDEKAAVLFADMKSHEGSFSQTFELFIFFNMPIRLCVKFNTNKNYFYKKKLTEI